MQMQIDEDGRHTRYGAVAQAFHWITAILVLVTFMYGPGGSEHRVYSAARDFDRQLHETLGSSAFVLVVLRLLWRSLDARPDPRDIPRWMDIASKAVQGSLYVLLFLLPATAIAGAWLEGHALTLLGGLQFAPPMQPSHDMGAAVAAIHTWLGDAILWVAGAHAAAALFHHFVLKDDVLASMLPAGIPTRRRR